MQDVLDDDKSCITSRFVTSLGVWPVDNTSIAYDRFSDVESSQIVCCTFAIDPTWQEKPSSSERDVYDVFVGCCEVSIFCMVCNPARTTAGPNTPQCMIYIEGVVYYRRRVYAVAIFMHCRDGSSLHSLLYGIRRCNCS